MEDLTQRLPITPEQRFHLFLEAACDYAIFFTDVDGGIVEWSSGAEKIIGYTEAEALQMNGRVIFTPDDRARRMPEAEMETAARNGQANDERWHLRKDGTLFFAVGRLVGLRDDDGRLVGYAKIIRDATPHKTLEQALRTSDAQFRATFAQAPIGMVLTDMAGRIQQVNAAFCRMTRFEDRELEARELTTLTAPEDRALARELLEEMIIGRREHTVLEKRLLRADGTVVWVQNSAAILRDAESRPICIIDLVQDISTLKLSEAELSRMVDQRTSALQAKTQQMEAFCYTVAHDLRAPLRAISGYAQYLREDFAMQLPAEGVDFLRRIEASAGRLDRLISDLLGYTRMQQVPIVREEIDLGAIVHHVVDQVRRDCGLADVEFHVATDLGRARADAITLEHVFLNLISNAVKFRRDGVTAMVRVYAEDRGSRLRVWIEDNGIGIDPRFAGRVFGMFERLHPDRKIPGTGVGLAIVAKAMERLGGSRGVEPNHPAGSRFWIELPK